MNYIKFSYKELERFCIDAFQKFGFSLSESKIISDVLLMSDLYGIESHGMQRLVRYHKGIEKGMIKVETKPETIFDTPISAVIDGHNGMGQLIGHHAMKIAIEKAEKTGIGIVTAKNSNHYGISGYYANMACEQGFIGFSTTNSEAIMVPTFGRRAMLGSNPIAMAMPADPYPFFFDASTSVVTRGKLEVYNKMDKPLPENWALDAQGHSSTDAPEVLANIAGKKGGGIMPLGGSEEVSGSHKGYGYGMLCEIFSSILSLGTTSNHTNVNNVAGICHSFVAINPAIFGDANLIREHLSNYLQELRDSDKADGKDKIYTHGEKEILSKEDKLKNGIGINPKTLLEVADACKYLDIDFEKYFGNLNLEDIDSNFQTNY